MEIFEGFNANFTLVFHRINFMLEIHMFVHPFLVVVENSTNIALVGGTKFFDASFHVLVIGPIII